MIARKWEIEKAVRVACVEWLQMCFEDLTAWELGFIDSCHRRLLLGELTLKQQIALTKLAMDHGFGHKQAAAAARAAKEAGDE